MDNPKRGRLIKRARDSAGPPVSYMNRANGNTSSKLTRSPSAASYFYSQQESQKGSQQEQHKGSQQGLGSFQPSSTTGASPQPQLRRSPSLLHPVHEQPGFQGNYLGPASVGPTFNSAAVDEALLSVKTGVNVGAGPRRPSPPQHSYTYNADQPSKYKNPTLRQSASFTALARKMDTPPSGSKSPRSNRYSDEGDAAKKRHSGGGKKKGTFSSFMSNLVSSPRRPTISTPTNPMHVTHVSIDNETGEFTVRGPLTGGSVPALGADALFAVFTLPLPLHCALDSFRTLTVPGPPQGMAAHVDQQRHHRAGTEAAPPGRRRRGQLLQRQRRKGRG